MQLDNLKTYRPLIDEHLMRAIDEFWADVKDDASGSHDQWVYGVVREYVARPGKRLRGSLAACLYDVVTQSRHSESGLRLAVVLELMHAYLLVVDDVMDRSSQRRGLPTVHEQYRKDFMNVRPTEFDAGMVAVSVGLFIQHLASWVMAGVSSDVVLHRALHRFLAVTCLGQITDVSAAGGADVSAEEIVRGYQQKSSMYTFVNPLVCALALAGRYRQAAERAVMAFGLPAGVAFQLRDDWLGMFGDSALSRKSVLDDIREGKRTYMMQHALAAASDEDRRVVLSILGNPQAIADDAATVREIMKRTGAVDVATRRMQVAADEAKQAAMSEYWPDTFSQLLKEVVQYSIERGV